MIQRALLDTRLAVRHALASFGDGARLASAAAAPSKAALAGTASDRAVDSAAEPAERSAVPLLVALSGGADSLALAAAVAYESRRLGIVAGAVIVDHGLQAGSATVAQAAAEQARGLGLAPVIVKRVTVGAAGGPEAAAREARYAAFLTVARQVRACAILTAHTRDDQAEQVLLALARGSGLRSLAGIPPLRQLIAEAQPHIAAGRAEPVRDAASPERGSAADGDSAIVMLRPFLSQAPEITRKVTVAACAEAGLVPWNDPHNTDHAYARVRVRERVLPVLRDELGEGAAAALARTADLAREDADALDELAARFIAAEARVTSGGEPSWPGAALSSLGASDEGANAAEVRVSVAELAQLPVALRGRVIRGIAAQAFGAHLSRERTLAIAELVTAWRGQGELQAPRLRVWRDRGEVVFARHAAETGGTAEAWDSADEGRAERGNGTREGHTL